MKRDATIRLTVALVAALGLARGAQAACVTTGDFDGDGRPDMRLAGGTGRTVLVLSPGPTDTTVRLDCNGDGDFTDGIDYDNVVFPGDFHVYDISLLGNDNITVHIPASWSGLQRSVQVLLGPGTNTVTLTADPGAALLASSRLKLEVAGYLHTDRVNLTLPAMDASSFAFQAELSAGTDDISVALGGDLTGGSVVDVDAGLNSAGNTFSFSQGGHSVVDSTLLLHVDGSVGTEKGNLTFDGPVSGASRVLLTGDLGLGSDLVTVNFDLGAFDVLGTSEVRLDLNGGTGNDILTFTRGTSSGGAGAVIEGVLDLRVSGGLGADTVTVDLAGGGFSLDGGTLGLYVDTGQATDKINVSLEAAPSSTDPHFDVYLAAGSQNDALTFNLVNGGPNTAANYGPAGTVFLDGGAGNNTCVIAGNGIVKPRLCLASFVAPLPPGPQAR